MLWWIKKFLHCNINCTKWSILLVSSLLSKYQNKFPWDGSNLINCFYKYTVYVSRGNICNNIYDNITIKYAIDDGNKNIMML